MNDLTLKKQKKIKTNFFFKLVILFLMVIALNTLFHFVAQNILGIEPQIGKILGTPSMYPTFPKSNKNFDKQLPRDIIAQYKVFKYKTLLSQYLDRFRYSFKRGDIVAFLNDEIEKSQEKTHYKKYYYLKRVIAIPGDTIEIKNNLVFINNQPIFEVYTAAPFSTKPGSYLPECTKKTIPANKLFVMGDNRIASLDSRNFGPIDYDNVEYYISWERDKGYFSEKSRDTSIEVKKFYKNNLSFCRKLIN